MPKLNDYSMTARSLKILGISLLTLIGIISAIFLYFFVYYTWQLRYGTPEKQATITKSLEGSFTKAGNTDAPSFRPDYQSFIRKENPTQGNAAAPVTIIMFIDFECPFCQAGYPIFNQVMDTFGDSIRVVFKEFPLTTIHPSARGAAEASMCAAEQQGFWKFYTNAFTTKKLDESSLYTYANASSIDMALFDRCFKEKKYSKAIDQDLSDGVALGVRGTPTYIVNGTFVEGVATFDEWKKIILDILNHT